MAKKSNPKYLTWLKKKPCMICGIMGVDPHHLPHDDPKHTRRYEDKNNVVPLCRICHGYMHENPKVEKLTMSKFKERAVKFFQEYTQEIGGNSETV